MKKLFCTTLHCCCFLLLLSFSARAQEFSLAGEWRFATDKGNVGVQEQWFTRQLPETVKLPGSMAENGKGDDITLNTKWTASIYDSSFFYTPRLAKFRQPGNIKVPFWLSPVKHYVGPAWYQKEVTIPANWKGKRMVLHLERVHITSSVWVNNQQVEGRQYSLVAPHEYDLSRYLTPGKHTITLRIDNTITPEVNVGTNSHSISDHTQGNWNGVVGRIELRATSQAYFSNIQLYPNLQAKTATVNLKLQNNTGRQQAVKLKLEAKSFNTDRNHEAKLKDQKINLKPGNNELEFTLPLGDKMLTWDEHHPALYLLTAKLEGKEIKEEKKVQFGMRDIKTDGTRITVNGKPTFLRGTLNNSEFPLTGYPSMDVPAWERIYTVAKAHGLNHFRFHSWSPPEAAFIAADKIGFYLQPEGPTWPNHSTSLGDGRPIDKFVYEETDRIAEHFGNYASFTMLAAGNEPRGGKQAQYLAEFIAYWKAKDSRRIYTGASVAMSWPLVPENEFMVKSGPRGLNWNNTRPETQSDYRDKIEAFQVPYVTHEMGQWVAFPNFKEIQKYTGAYRAKNFELFREDLQDRGMGDRAEDFLMASGKLQALSYRQEIEKSFRTPGLAGFQLLGLQDFPGQGTALVGVVDAFWDSKGYITATEFSRFCNTIVPLSRIPKFVYTSNESFRADIEIHNSGASDLANTLVQWTVKDAAGATIGSGSFPASNYAVGTNTPAGKVELPLAKITQASKLNLEVKVAGTDFANDWNFWVYPVALPAVKSDVYYTTVLDKKAEDVLQKGGKVFLNAAGKVVKGKEIVMYYTPVFWNTSWFKMRPPHVTGSYIDASHPAFASFPTENFTDLQWWEVVNRAQVMHLEDFPKGFRSLVQPIDTWFMNRQLGLIYEAKVGNGKLLVSSADLGPEQKDRPVARQLFHSLQVYMNSDKFNPQQQVPLAQVQDLFKTASREQWDSFTRDSPDELKPNQGQR